MRKFLVGVAFGLSVGLVEGADYDMKLKDVVEAIADYDVTHLPVLPVNLGNGRYHFNMGLTVYPEKKININSLATDDARRLAVIHELYHASFHNKGIHQQSEIQVDVMAKEKYKEIYGKEFVMPETMDTLLRRR